MSHRLARIDWIRILARPYLKGYRSRREAHGDLRGFWFDAPGSAGRAGFFAGYLVGAEQHTHLRAKPPECVVFARVAPRSALHRKLVRPERSLFRKTFEYIRWLTHRPPRFEFFEDGATTMIRHQSMQEWPPEKYEHLSRNFFIETLAWLVRSGLVRRLAEETSKPARRKAAVKKSMVRNTRAPRRG